MPTSWPKKRRLIGTKVQRIDGPAKATGTAKYSYDINRPGMLHGMILRCPHAHAKIKSLDASTAEKMPGVKAVYAIKKAGDELFYAGEEVFALAADTEEHAHDALRAIKVEYEVLPFLVKEEDALKQDKATVPPAGGNRNNVRPGTGGGQSANVDEGFKKADATHTGTYGMPVICHQCLESHGLVAEWDKDGGLTVWASTQAVTGTAQALAGTFSVPAGKVKCITHYMGGGFGSKFGPDIQGTVAAHLAKIAGAPVKLMLDREAEIIAAGNRPSAFATVKIAGTKDGKITAYEIDVHGTPGVGGAGSTVGPLPYVYPFESRRKNTVIRLNTGSQRAMRAPGHPQSCYLTECAIDDVAALLGLDPLQVRLKNLPQNDSAAINNSPLSYNALKHTIYSKEIEIAAELAKWKEKWHPPGKGNGNGPLKHGIGMGIHTWGGAAQGQPNDCTVFIASDGSVKAQSSTQDLGTAQRTVTALVVAEILGLEPKEIITEIGENQFGRSSGSGGSTTCPSQAPAALRAATTAKEELFKAIAPKLDSKPEDLDIEPGKIVNKATNKSWSWKEACARLGMTQIKATGTWTAAEANANPGVSNQGVGGVQIAEVVVDTETGLVRCTQVVAVQDVGLVVNKQGCESQMAGGIIMGVNYALFEERIMDRVTGRQCNPDMEFYKLGGIEDMPKIIVHMHDMSERGVIGIGEPATISTHAAIGNAIFNAIGVRVPYTPFTPDRVLAALAAKGGKS